MRSAHAVIILAVGLCMSSALAGEKPGGIAVLLGDAKCERALELARTTGLTVLVQLKDDAAVAAARAAADKAGVLNRRVFVAKGDGSRIPLADNVADQVLVLGGVGSPQAEVLRVLRPGATATIGGKKIAKPFPKGVDDWSHHYHGPDNNPQSKDTVIRAPYLTQFIADPRYASNPQSAVSSAGRLFMAFGHVAWHKREEGTLNTLLAVNGYNGSVLWRRPIKSGLMVDRSTMIATADTLYLADDVSCKLIDAATGKVKGEITVPEKRAGGTFWKWTGLVDGVLYALVGEAEPMDPVKKWRRARHGWPWGGISKGYNAPRYGWGFAKTLFAIDVKTKRVLWHHTEAGQIDSRGLCVRGGRVYASSFGKYLVCLNAKTGKPVWRRTAGKDADLFKAIGPYRPGHGYIGGWKSTVFLKATDGALFFIGPQTNWLTALSAKDGSLLWKHRRKDLHVVIRDDGVYIVGPQNSRNETKKLDTVTGKVLATYPISRRACTRSTGTADSIFFRAPGGTIRLDLKSGKPEYMSPMRPSCQAGVIPANGHLYWMPWACDCQLQMFGVIGLGPAGKFDFARKAVEAERLEVAAGADKLTALAVSPDDWPAYRRDSARSGRTKVTVPDVVKLLWHARAKTAFEATAPVAAGGLVFVAGDDGIVRALDAKTGAEKWRAYTGGSVRYPPAIADGRAFVGSGDGRAYAFEAATGRLLWRFRAAPAERKIPVYGQLPSTWPVAAGVLVDQGVAYFAAGINSFDGTHVYAVDVATGKLRWHNSTSGRLPGGNGRGAGVQGDLLLHKGMLHLAAGNGAGVAMYDVKDGRCPSRGPNRGSLGNRGRELALAPNGRVVVTGQPLYSAPDSPVFDRPVTWKPWAVTAGGVRLWAGRQKGAKQPVLLAAGADKKPLWTQPLPGEPVRWGIAVAAAGRIIVTLRNGDVLCFGKK
jgi:outer membrane protein assembly factor BamB